MVELVHPAGAPLRAWVTEVRAADGHDDTAEIAPAALRMLALAEGTEVQIRAVHSGILGS